MPAHHQKDTQKFLLSISKSNNEKSKKELKITFSQSCFSLSIHSWLIGNIYASWDLMDIFVLNKKKIAKQLQRKHPFSPSVIKHWEMLSLVITVHSNKGSSSRWQHEFKLHPMFCGTAGGLLYQFLESAYKTPTRLSAANHSSH